MKFIVGGSDEFSQTGIGTNTPSVIHTSPQLVSFPINTKIVAIEAGQYFNLAYTDDNRIFGWGAGRFLCFST
jgi:alpha-tubulin suppressor-like RCC1 family protein